MSIELEYAVKKDIRNNSVVRQADARQRAELRRMVAMAALVVAMLLFSAWQHFGRLDATKTVEQLRAEYAREQAVNRQLRLNLERLRAPHATARCIKKRDSETGALSGFAVESGDVRDAVCLVVDDICDGGGTFSGIAAVLREAGARSVSLAVTHGVFSRGIELAGIDTTYCTDSYGMPKADGYEVARDGHRVT